MNIKLNLPEKIVASGCALALALSIAFNSTAQQQPISTPSGNPTLEAKAFPNVPTKIAANTTSNLASRVTIPYMPGTNNLTLTISGYVTNAASGSAAFKFNFGAKTNLISTDSPLTGTADLTKTNYVDGTNVITTFTYAVSGGLREAELSRITSTGTNTFFIRGVWLSWPVAPK